MVWLETDEPGVWHDQFDGVEKVFLGMSKAFAKLGKEHGSVYACCQFSVLQNRSQEPIEALLRDSWKALRFDYPALSVFADGSLKVYNAASPQVVEAWATETFWVDSVNRADDIIPTLHLKRLPCLVYLSNSSEIIFHSSHWRIDALGTCMILNRYFDILASYVSGACRPPRWHLEAQNLSLSLEDAAGCNASEPTESMRALAEIIRRRNFDTSYPSAGLPCNSDATVLPAVHRTHAVSLAQETTAQLVTACKRGNISVTAAVHAACAEYIFSLSKRDQYSTIVSVNFRDDLRSPYGTSTRACATYVSGITHTVQRDDNFSAKTTALTKAYKGDDWNRKEYLAAMRVIVKVHVEALQAMAGSAVPREPATNVTVSSLGVVDKHLKKDHGSSVVVEQFRLGSAIMTRQPTLYVWTFQGQLTLSVDYNESFYDEEAVSSLLNGIIQCLERELLVESDAETGIKN